MAKGQITYKVLFFTFCIPVQMQITLAEIAQVAYFTENSNLGRMMNAFHISIER